jgi:HK97 family phage portal protein
MCLEGVSYSRIVVAPNGAISLWPMAANRTRADLGPDGNLRYLYSDQTGKQIPLRWDEVLRIPFATTDGIKPLSVIGAQRETLGASLATQDYGSRFFANDATPKTYLKMPGRFTDKDSRNAFRRDWQELQTGPNRGKTALLEDGMELGSLGVSNEDAQYLETRKFQRSEIAGMFRVPLHLIGDLERSTNNNIEQQSLEFIAYDMMPWFKRWEQGLSVALLDDNDQEEFFFEFLIDGWLRGDSVARSQFYRDAIYSGWMSRNEVRTRENLNKALGLDEFIVPVNMTLSDMLGQIGGGSGTGKTNGNG